MFDLYLVKNDFKLIFIRELSPQSKSGIEEINHTYIHSKRFLSHCIEEYFERGHKFSHISEKYITTVSSLSYMTYEF